MLFFIKKLTFLPYILHSFDYQHIIKWFFVKNMRKNATFTALQTFQRLLFFDYQTIE